MNRFIIPSIILLLISSSLSFLRNTQEQKSDNLTSSNSTSSGNTTISSNSTASNANANSTEITLSTNSTSIVISASATSAAHSDSITEEQNEAINDFCFLNNKGVIYNLNPLKASLNYTTSNSEGNYIFSICQNLNFQCNKKTGMVYHGFNFDKQNDCSLLAGSNSVLSKIYIVEEKQKNKINSHIEIVLPNGETCKENNKEAYQTNYELHCDNLADNLQVKSVKKDKCELSISMFTKHACPKYDYASFFNSIKENKYILAAILILLGAFFCFVGENFLKITQVIAGSIVSLIFILYLLFKYAHVEIGSAIFWVIIAFSLAISILIGFLLSKIYWLTGLMFGFLLGVVLGFVLITVTSSLIQINLAIAITIMILTIILGIVIGFKKEEEVSIISTSIVGAYGIVRGISILCGGLPSEEQVYQDKKVDFSKAMIVYLILFIILSVLGMIIQFKYFYDRSKKVKSNEVKA